MNVAHSVSYDLCNLDYGPTNMVSRTRCAVKFIMSVQVPVKVTLSHSSCSEIH